MLSARLLSFPMFRRGRCRPDQLRTHNHRAADPGVELEPVLAAARGLGDPAFRDLFLWISEVSQSCLAWGILITCAKGFARGIRSYISISGVLMLGTRVVEAVVFTLLGVLCT